VGQAILSPAYPNPDLSRPVDELMNAENRRALTLNSDDAVTTGTEPTGAAFPAC
jgi:hypothetical protein